VWCVCEGVCVGCVCVRALGGVGGQMERPHTISQGRWGNGMWGGLAPVKPSSIQ
jgi:hypothetical protein